LDLQLKSARNLINHLVSWGEVTRFELSGITGAQDWITGFEKAGILQTAATDIWSLSPEFWSLLGKEELEVGAMPTVFFQMPEYRGYLISILAEGAASAAKQGLNDEVEKWSGDELLPFLSAINQILDEIEINGYRLVDGKSAEIIKKFDQYRKSKYFSSSLLSPNSLSDWNQLLLGRTARQQDLIAKDSKKVKITDFGVSKRFEDAWVWTKRHGTEAYMAPEVALEGKRSKVSDIFSLGVLPYEMTTGSLPYTSPHQLLTGLNISKPQEINTDIPSDLEQVILKAMERRPGKRYQSVGELRADVDRCVDSLSASNVMAELPSRSAPKQESSAPGTNNTTSDWADAQGPAAAGGRVQQIPQESDVIHRAGTGQTGYHPQGLPAVQ